MPSLPGHVPPQRPSWRERIRVPSERNERLARIARAYPEARLIDDMASVPGFEPPEDMIEDIDQPIESLPEGSYEYATTRPCLAHEECDGEPCMHPYETRLDLITDTLDQHWLDTDSEVTPHVAVCSCGQWSWNAREHRGGVLTLGEHLRPFSRHVAQVLMDTLDLN